MPKIDMREFLSEEVLTIWKDEEKLRTAYRTNAAADLAPHQGLVPLFSPDNRIHTLPVKYEPHVQTEYCDGNSWKVEERWKFEDGAVGERKDPG